MSEKTKPVDSGDRERAAGDLSRSYIVEAAAGTGKTTLLVSRILNLIKQKHARPDDIVAITFTERAAAELKAKLNEKLAEDLAHESGETAAYVEQALADLERMQVTTIHSFCTTLLKERPVEAGVDPNFEVADELMSGLIAESVWDEWLARHMDGDDPVLGQAVLLGMTVENMNALAESLRNNRDLLSLLPHAADMTADLEDFGHKLPEVISQLKAMADDCCTSSEDGAAVKIAELNQCVRELAQLKSRESLEAFIVNRLVLPRPGRLGNKGNWSPCETLAEVRERLQHIREAHSHVISRIGHNTLALLGQKLLGYIDAYEKAKQDEGVLDFHDLLICTHAMLRQNPAVRRYFRKRYKYLLIDEFQDTDPLQAEIIFFLSEDQPGKAKTWRDAKPGPGNVFFVGDPKQSIYRFRRADIEMYASARAKLGKPNLLTIHQNFRCAPSIIDVVNSIFAEIITPPPDGDYQPDYVPLHFGRDRKTLPPEHGVVLLYPPPSVRGLMTNAEARRTYESRCIAAFVKEIVKDDRWKIWDTKEGRLRPVMLKDIAVLMRTQTGLEIIEDVFRLYGVDYRVVGGKHFYVRQEVQQLLAVLRAVDNPYDTIALVAALRSPFFGVSDEELFLYYSDGGDLSYRGYSILKSLAAAMSQHPLVGDSGAAKKTTTAGDTTTSVEFALDVLGHLHSVRNDVSVGVLLNRLYSLTGAAVTYLLKPNGEQRVANLSKIADTARALYDRGICTLRGFVTWLSQREAEEAEESEAMTVEAGDDFVRILTVHKAKGLEFPVAILADLAKVPRAQSERFIIDRRNQEIGILVGRKESGIMTDNYQALDEYEAKRSEAEEKRLLYVAMTRARDHLVIPAYWASEREVDRDGQPKPGTLLSYIAAKIPIPEMAGTAGSPKGMMIYDTSCLSLTPREPPPFRLPIELQGHEAAPPESAEAELVRWHEDQAKIEARVTQGHALVAPTDEVLFDEAAYPGEGAVFGTLVHRLLEVVDWRAADGLESIAEIEARSIGAPEPMVGKAVEMVKQTLESDFVGRILRSDRYFKEVPFAFKRNGTIVEGKMDVVFEEGDDIIVVDFKTDKISKPYLAGKVETYKPQTDAYALAIRHVFSKPPKQVFLFFLHLMQPVPVPIEE